MSYKCHLSNFALFKPPFNNIQLTMRTSVYKGVHAYRVPRAFVQHFYTIGIVI